eukprot:COSAG02_NODE_9704_length_2137_cov_1.705103_2_plen_39_part_01
MTHTARLASAAPWGDPLVESLQGTIERCDILVRILELLF